jgi:hypothetical protein
MQHPRRSARVLHQRKVADKAPWSRAALRRQSGHRQSSVEPAGGIGSRKSSAAHQHAPAVLPHSNAAPQRAQVRERI